MGAPSSERWAVIVPLLDAALELAPEDRPAFLTERCATDPGLRQDVERLLGPRSEPTPSSRSRPRKSCLARRAYHPAGTVRAR